MVGGVDADKNNPSTSQEGKDLETVDDDMEKIISQETGGEQGNDEEESSNKDNINDIFQNALALAMADSNENTAPHSEEPEENSNSKPDDDTGKDEEELNFEFLNKLLAEQHEPQHEEGDEEKEGETRESSEKPPEESEEADLEQQLTAALQSTTNEFNNNNDDNDDNNTNDNETTNHDDRHDNEHNDESNKDSELSNIEAVLASLLTSNMEQGDIGGNNNNQQRSQSKPKVSRKQNQQQHATAQADSGPSLSIAETLAITRSNMMQQKTTSQENASTEATTSNNNNNNSVKVDPMLQRRSSSQHRSNSQSGFSTPSHQPSHSPPPNTSSIPRRPPPPTSAPLPQSQHQTKFQIYTPALARKQQNSKSKKNGQKSSSNFKPVTTVADSFSQQDLASQLTAALEAENDNNASANSNIDPELANAFAAAEAATTGNNIDQNQSLPPTEDTNNNEMADSSSTDAMSSSESSMIAALLLAKQMFGSDNEQQQIDSGKNVPATTSTTAQSFEGDSNERYNATAAAAASSADDDDNTDNISSETIDAVQAALQALGKSLEIEEGGIKKEDATSSKKRATKAIARARHKIRNSILTPEDKERIKEDNRDRKKRWRDSNAGRNKDNDLRTRVNKKANSLFGEDSTAEKQDWIQKEYEKRRLWRVRKEMDTLNNSNSRNNKNKITTIKKGGNNNSNGVAAVSSTNQGDSISGSNSDELRMMFESLGKSGGDNELNEAFNAIAKDSNLLKNLADLFSHDSGHENSSNEHTNNKRPATESIDHDRSNKKLNNTAKVEDLTNLISEAVEQPNNSRLFTAPKSTNSSHILPQRTVPPSRPPQYTTNESDNKSTEASSESNNDNTSNGSDNRSEDRRVKALGFPPLLTGMAIKR